MTLTSGMVFKHNESEDYFIFDRTRPIVGSKEVDDMYAVGIHIGRDTSNDMKWAIRRNICIKISDLDKTHTYINESVSLDGILLTGIVASLQLGIRR